MSFSEFFWVLCDGLIFVLLCALIWVSVEAIRVLRRIRVLVERAEFLSDVKNWMGFINLFRKKKS